MDQKFDIMQLQKQGSVLLKVKDGAKCNALDGVLEIDNKKYLKIPIKAIPEKGKANKMIIDFLAKEWNISKQDLEISAGKTGQYKVLKVKQHQIRN